ncbi:MAG: thioredoxin family protein [Gaiellaceae bacterium]
MRDLDAAGFDEAIAGDPLLVDFWAPWCRPCKALEPILTELQATVPVARVNVDDHPGIGARYDVLSIPTVILFAGGAPAGSMIGIRPKAHFDEWLAEVLPAAQRNVDA